MKVCKAKLRNFITIQMVMGGPEGDGVGALLRKWTTSLKKQFTLSDISHFFHCPRIVNSVFLVTPGCTR